MLGKLKCLTKDVGGNVTTFLAIAAIPMVVAAGAGIDYIRAIEAQTELQAAVDGAAMAVASAQGGTKKDKLQTGLHFFQSNFTDPHFPNPKPTIDLTDTTVTVSAEFGYPMSFMGLVGVDTFTIGAASEVELGVDRNVELVLVLDYSKSMEEHDKYKRMSAAATKMIDTIAAVKSGTWLKVGLVPFSAMVRATMPAEYVSQASAGAEWTGCTQDRSYPVNTTVATPDGSAETKWGYIDNGFENAKPYDCPAYGAKKLDILPLTDNLAAVKTKLSEMLPLGNTNIPLGTEFGWNLLDPDAPYTEAVPYTDDKTKKFIIVLTDGVQTSKQWGADGNRTVPHGQDNLVTICSGIRAKSITVFAIAYDVVSPAVTDLLKKCAPGNYFEPDVDGTEIDAVFRAITVRIKKSTLRLAR